MAKILLVEDDPDLSAFVREWLEFEKFRVEQVDDGADALQMLQVTTFDVVILDWDLPSMPGTELCRRFRAAGGTTPVLMLTGKQAIDDKVAAFGVGADDYLTKPFHLNELSARLKALLRRGTVASDNKLRLRDIELDRLTHDVYVKGELIKLYPREYDLLEFLMTNPNVAFSADDLLSKVWTMDANASETAVRTCIKTLRRKISGESDDSPIETVHGVGYKFRA